jgi:hypothetical protein
MLEDALHSVNEVPADKKFRPTRSSGQNGSEDMDDPFHPLYGLWVCASSSLLVIAFLVEAAECFDVPDFLLFVVAFRIILAVHFNVRR